MAGTGRETVIDGRAAQAPRVSLLSVPNVVVDDPHFGQGIAWSPECGSDGQVAAGVCAPAAARTLGAVPAAVPAQYAQPIVVWAADKCSVMQARDFFGRARRKLQAARPFQLERELWEGTVAQAQGYGNPFLRSSDTVDLTPATGALKPRAALATLEQALSRSLTQPVIHATVAAAYFLPEVRLDGATWKTKKETVVVPGSGYTGLGPLGNSNATPAAGETWLFGTGMVDVRFGPVITTPEDQGGDPDDLSPYAASMDRSTNDFEVRAQQLAVATFDPCIHVAVRMAFAGDESTAEIPNTGA